MDNMISQAKETFAKAFLERIRSRAFDFQEPDADSVLEFLYSAYSNDQDQDPDEIRQGFVEMDKYLEGIVSLEENNTVFEIVCKLCSACEKRVFIDAIQIGAQLMLELQGN